MKLTGGVLGGVFGLLFYFANPSAQSFILFAIVAGIGFVGPDVWISRARTPGGSRSSACSRTRSIRYR